MSDNDCTIFVLTDTPGMYGEALHRDGRTPVFLNDINDLLDRLKDVAMAGLVLEINKVMNASRRNRDRLFHYSASFPILRTKPNPQHGFVDYLDPREHFLHNLVAAMGKWDRNHARVHVDLPCTYSHENDPIMSSPIEARVLDISPGGCFLHSLEPTEEKFIHLRLPLKCCTRPIYSSVRWVRMDGDKDLRGMGLMFIDPTKEQIAEITSIRPKE